MSNEKKEIDSNEYIAIYSGRDKEAKILVNGDQIKIHEARDEMLGNLRSIAKCINDSQMYLTGYSYLATKYYRYLGGIIIYVDEIIMYL